MREVRQERAGKRRAAGTLFEAIVSGDKDLLDHPGLEPPVINARDACKLLGLLGLLD